jgi:hypothetical protein
MEAPCSLVLSQPDSAVDPCVGQGTALRLLTSGALIRLSGVELDADRAQVAKCMDIDTVQGNVFEYETESEIFLTALPQRTVRLGDRIDCHQQYGTAIPRRHLSLALTRRHSDVRHTLRTAI